MRRFRIYSFLPTHAPKRCIFIHITPYDVQIGPFIKAPLGALRSRLFFFTAAAERGARLTQVNSVNSHNIYRHSPYCAKIRSLARLLLPFFRFASAYCYGRRFPWPSVYTSLKWFCAYLDYMGVQLLILDTRDAIPGYWEELGTAPEVA